MPIGRILVLSCRYSVFVSHVQPVAIHKALFLLVCIFLMLVFDMIGSIWCLHIAVWANDSFKCRDD